VELNEKNVWDILLEKIKALGIDEKELWWYLDLRKFGDLPCIAVLDLVLKGSVIFATGMGKHKGCNPISKEPHKMPSF